VLRQGLMPVWIGLALGMAAALAVGRLVASLLYGVTASDPAIMSGAAAVLLAVAAVACYLPARRATRVDPVRALRYE
jgi:putative ABC transport system permease protein